MKKLFLGLLMAALITGCGSGTSSEQTNTELNVFIAASLDSVMTELAQSYEGEHPGVVINLNADSSGTLANQIKEGADCDIFFSAAQDKMDALEDNGLVKDGTRKDIINNRLVLITYKNSGTTVTGLESLANAKSIALAGGTVPAGAYTRKALIALGKLEATDDVSIIDAREVSEAFGGVEISEQDNVSKVLTAVAEGACEVGTVYYSDTYGFEDKVDIIEYIDNSLTGDITYPAALIENANSDEAQAQAAEDFLTYISSEDNKSVYEAHFMDFVAG